MDELKKEFDEKLKKMQLLCDGAMMCCDNNHPLWHFSVNMRSELRAFAADLHNFEDSE